MSARMPFVKYCWISLLSAMFCLAACLMRSFLSEPGIGNVMLTVWSGFALRGLCGIAFYECGEVFGDGHVVCVGLFYERVF